MTILDKIISTKNEEVKILKQNYTYSRFNDSKFFENPRLSLSKALSSKGFISIIAEIKKASPSKGIIRENFNHLEIADIYFNNEVSAISILTDVNYFKGSINYLRDIADIKSAPLLRKDFIIDEYQVFEAKSNGADAILLICEALSKNQISELTLAAKENDLEVLLELHSEEQIVKIDFDINNIIGINNRDLSTFKVDIGSTEKIAEKLPESVIVVSESGIQSKQDLEYLRSFNTNAVLVGEHFMRSNSIGDSIKHFKEWCLYES